jgi:hypothetical protein
MYPQQGAYVQQSGAVGGIVASRCATARKCWRQHCLCSLLWGYTKHTTSLLQCTAPNWGPRQAASHCSCSPPSPCQATPALPPKGGAAYTYVDRLKGRGVKQQLIMSGERPSARPQRQQLGQQQGLEHPRDYGRWAPKDWMTHMVPVWGHCPP